MLTLQALETACGAIDKLAALNLQATVMRAAWALVAPKGDWKAKVDITLPEYTAREAGYDWHIIRAAVGFMTATEATIVRVSDTHVRVVAKGYRAGPAA